MSAYLLEGAISNAINFPSITAGEAPKLRPYVKLVEHAPVGRQLGVPLRLGQEAQPEAGDRQQRPLDQHRDQHQADGDDQARRPLAQELEEPVVHRQGGGTPYR